MALLVIGLDQPPYPLSVVSVGVEVVVVVDMLLRDKDANEDRMLPLLLLLIDDDEKGDDGDARIVIRCHEETGHSCRCSGKSHREERDMMLLWLAAVLCCSCWLPFYFVPFGCWLSTLKKVKEQSSRVIL
jgi:hypothetical protein